MDLDRFRCIHGLVLSCSGTDSHRQRPRPGCRSTGLHRHVRLGQLDLKDFRRLPLQSKPEVVPDLGRADEAEWISYDGEIQEAVLWFGLLGRRTSLPTPVRKATLLPCGASLAGRGLPEPAVRPVGRYLYEPDAAVVYARLVAEVAQDVTGGLVDEGGALITATELHHTPFATAYEITKMLPFNRAAFRATLRERAVGRVVVAARGLGTEPDEFQHELAPQNPDAATVFITGTADRPTVLIVSPIPDTREPQPKPARTGG
ncbi:hypothetical protein OG730_00745 [Streptomyces sp. NBC_01298]|uniref:THUMP-like domain-containing protein n=1 Tax=Streptomyces sp. NBC_01298 TaxID=2903817 RepID=UPI002E1641E7|nr:hypothetical protein OG730_00745 [Streptomyces sp. NBC_01298]